MEDVTARQKKELKALDGAKRAAIKKAKGQKGKKGKELLASTEAEYETKLKELQERHAAELSEPTDGGDSSEAKAAAPPGPAEPEPPKADPAEEERLRKQEKARKKREAKKEKERLRQEELEREAAEAGPSMRAMELEALELQLKPASLTIHEIPSDGNCLYRAVAEQVDGADFHKIRGVCAAALKEQEDEFAPFCEFTDTVTNFDQYVERVRNSSEWGGHLELRALSQGLKRPIVVYAASKPKLTMGEENDGEAILLSYHLHYYSLGEHYNQVVKR